jgi:hypothetical protein
VQTLSIRYARSCTCDKHSGDALKLGNDSAREYEIRCVAKLEASNAQLLAPPQTESYPKLSLADPYELAIDEQTSSVSSDYDR